MTVCTEAVHQRLHMAPFSIPFRSLAALHLSSMLVLPSLAFTSSADSSVAAGQLHASDVMESTVQRHDQHQPHGGDALLDVRLREDNPRPGTVKPSNGRRRRRRRTGSSHRQKSKDHDNSAPPIEQGNSFIMLKAPVRKVAAPPPSAEDQESAAPALPKVSVHRNEVNSSANLTGSANTTNSTIVASPKALPQRPAFADGIGMRVAHLFSRTLGNVTATKAAPGKHKIDVAAFALNLIVSILLVFAAYHAVRSWRHRTLVRSVQAKVHRANEAFLGLHGDRSLCCCCVEFMPSASPTTVTFLCGHGFHMWCVNDWYKRHSCGGVEAGASCPGRCPICAGQCNSSPPSIEAVTSASPQGCSTFEAQACGRTEATADCARLFTLHNLCEKYQGILSKDDTDKLVAQPTAVLQSEIHFARHCPRSKSPSFFG